MQTNKPKLKKTSTFNTHISQTLTMNAAQDIKIINIYLQFKFS